MKAVNISQWKYAVINGEPRQEIVALTNDKELALAVENIGVVVSTSAIRAFKINGEFGEYITGQFI